MVSWSCFHSGLGLYPSMRSLLLCLSSSQRSVCPGNGFQLMFPCHLAGRNLLISLFAIFWHWLLSMPCQLQLLRPCSFFCRAPFVHARDGRIISSPVFHRSGSFDSSMKISISTLGNAIYFSLRHGAGHYKFYVGLPIEQWRSGLVCLGVHCIGRCSGSGHDVASSSFLPLSNKNISQSSRRIWFLDFFRQSLTCPDLAGSILVRV